MPTHPQFEDHGLIRLGVSSCLLGEKVRFDGNHKQDGYITETLSHFFEFVRVCPEVAIGMGVPRAPIRLVGDPQDPRAVGVRDSTLDVTAKLATYGRRMAKELTGISGYILKSKSPSCGALRVKVYAEGGGSSKQASGIYARAFMDAQPLLPVEEEGRLLDPVLRENFIERVFAFHRWQTLVESGLTPGKLVAFHTAHKLTLMAHSTVYYRELGQWLAKTGKQATKNHGEEYIHQFMHALTRLATPKRHSNVLMHLLGYLKKYLDASDKAEMLELIDAYRRGQLPLIVPISLLKHHFRRHPDPYVALQVYLNPHPRELMLRNAV